MRFQQDEGQSKARRGPVSGLAALSPNGARNRAACAYLIACVTATGD